MKPFAKRAVEIPRSGIREIMAMSAEMEDVIHLEVGQPDFDTPQNIVDATVEAARAGNTKYIANAGITQLRQAAANYFQTKTGVKTTVDNILVTQGAVMSVATAFLALLEPGDEVLLPDPGWPNYMMAVSLLNGEPVYYSLRPEADFLPSIEDLEELVTPRTKLILLCTPSNPTGQVYDEQTMSELVDFARRHDLYLLSDEIYGETVFDKPHSSALSFDTDDRTLIVTGMSKTYAMTGYRVGFTRGSKEYVDLATKLQEPIVSCGVGFAQMAAIEALNGPQEEVKAMCAAYKSRRDAAIEVLKEHNLYRYTPGGAFYLLVDISSTGMDSRDFAIKLLKEKGVAVAPGNTFGELCRGHVRISIASDEANVREGLKRICLLIKELS